MGEQRAGGSGVGAGRPATVVVSRPAGSTRLRFGRGAGLSDRMFRRLCRENPGLRLERSARGALIIMAPAGAGSAGRNIKIGQQLANWSDATGLGYAFDSSAGFRLPNGAIRSPDASWIAKERWEALSKKDQEDFAPICPDFVVELKSPSDRMGELRAKMREYLAQGARLGWLIDPRRRVAEVYRPEREVERLENPARLSGEEVLPGFVMETEGIFM